jgi:hypothetical protein
MPAGSGLVKFRDFGLLVFWYLFFINILLRKKSWEFMELVGQQNRT